MKSSIFDSYSVVGMITSELPLTARGIMASFSSSVVFMFLRVVDSERVLCVCLCEGLLFFFKALMRSAVSVLYTSLWKGGRLEMAVSASRARFRIQFLCLSCRFCFGPFRNRAISGL